MQPPMVILAHPPPPPPARHHLFDFVVVDQPAGIRLANASLNLFDMPALHFQIGTHRLVQQISAVAVQRLRERVQGLNFIFIQPKADGLLVRDSMARHIMKYYSVSSCTSRPKRW